MRVTNQYSLNTFTNDHSKVLGELNKLNAQISSGQKIQNSYEDSSVYTNVLKFESQENELSAIKERSVQARVMADSTDSALNDFTQTLRDFNTKLIGASNATMNKDNLESIATELEEMKKHMMSLSNTKVNGQYLFSGSNTNVKPIDTEGNYHGNGDALMTSVGDGVKIQRNIDGQSLFLGDDLNIHKTIETNVKLTNQIDKDAELTAESTIRDMVGDKDDDATNDKSVDFFISGKKRDGTAFKNIVNIDANKNVGDLLDKIASAYDNEVNVSLSKSGTIEITDKQSGYSSIDFKMVGVQNWDGNDKGNLNNVKGDKIISFMSGEPLKNDQQYFSKNGGTLEGNVSFVADGAFATSKTTFNDIASASMDGKSFEMKLNDINGQEQTVTLNLGANSTFKIGGTTYNIYNADQTPTTSENFTMGQLNNIVSMVTSGELPASNDASGFEAATVKANKLVSVDINDKGHLEIQDKSNEISKIEFSMYDTDANDFNKTSTPSISFMSDNAVTTAEAHLSFFDEIDNIITSVREGIVNLDSSSSNPRNIGMNNSLNKIEQMSNHFNNAQAKIGVRSKSLEIAEQKASALEVNVKLLKSETTEVDTAETIMKLNQTTLTYQAMLQTVTKVNSLSLLNYMK